MRDLMKYAEFCMELLDNINVPYTKPFSWTVNKRATRRWGRCRKSGYYGDYSIDISSILLDERASENDLIETILHELIHTCPSCMNHGYEWKHWGDKVTKAYGYEILRTKKGDENSAALMLEKKKSNANYVCVCEKCGHEFYYNKWCKVTANPSSYTHSNCGGHLKLKTSKKTVYSYSGWFEKNTTADYKVTN